MTPTHPSTTRRTWPILAAAAVLPWVAACRGSTPHPADGGATADGGVLATTGCDAPWPTLCGEIPRPKKDRNALYLSQLAWQTFIALSWPATDVEQQRGAALDPNDPTVFGQKVGNNGVPVVWETWKQDWELFVPGGEPPSAWDSYDVAVAPCDVIVTKSGKQIPVTAAQWPKYYERFGRDLINIGNQPKQSSNTQKSKLEVAGPLIDQHGGLVKAESRFGQVAYEYIAGNGYYSRASWPDGGIVMPAATPSADGTITTKASWRPYAKGDDLSRFYWRDMLVWSVVGQQQICTQTRMLLVGMHVTYKNSFLPAKASGCSQPVDQYLWATFEQVDNVPPPCESGQCSFYCTPGAEGCECSDACIQACESQGYSYQPMPLPEGVVDEAGDPVAGDPEPVEVCRLQPIDRFAYLRQANTEYHQVMASAGTSAWPYYELVNLQWMQNNGPSCQFRPLDRVANATLETYDQTNSCMNCHRGFVEEGPSLLEVQDADFIWTLALEADPPSAFEQALRSSYP
ncbi:MAG: hypothetical protein KDK70_01570 [Myxococcales bacterium]|nr:hypothetical protein [Myxococcales bacterium]